MANTIQSIFEAMPGRYIPGVLKQTTSYYFSVGDHKWTVVAGPDGCKATPGKQVDNADCVLKCDPGLFEKMVLNGKMPGPIDIARGKIKTNRVDLLKQLPSVFKMGS